MNLRRHPRLFLASLTTLVGLLLLSPVTALAATETSANEPALDPSEEFALPDWISIKLGPIDMSINKAVLYIFLATALTVIVMVYAARKMAARPTGRLQTVTEMAFGLMRDNITRGNMDPRMASKWFPFIATLFLFIWFSNMIGYIPLPTNSSHTFDLAGIEVPSFALYAATANISIPLVLALVVWIAYHVEGIRVHGFVGYIRSWVPKGVEGFMVGPILLIEALSHFVRLISLSLRLFANILAGHLLILFMAGGLVILLGMGVFGSVILGISTGTLAVVFFLFEIGLVATLQAFIFSTLTAIYLGGAVAEEH
ncbi:F0F1 ATP synthase subunit A [Conexibacter woesei]|uniref:ATP synthase subunit a n=1 Tax=Conexibacter woesei (strain DSM 14684 / CCUG 47730 / CIP 108061 / JCM 11494 / NBRC 100937 / ID131577) TaxID=469383 RepID=D3F942_CONWI|nr:F0F1 ATP synthase subunit A [Conexibacter woesei]ADB53037.1 ATP synthase F0, A subunit [Conexibacter woesei DSM 14684]